ESIEKRLFRFGVSPLVDLPRLQRERQFVQLATDHAGVVQLVLRLRRDLLGYPHDSANRRQRKQGHRTEHTHQGLPAATASSSSETNEYGGSGPVNRNRIRPRCSSSSWPTARANSS